MAILMAIKLTIYLKIIKGIGTLEYEKNINVLSINVLLNKAISYSITIITQLLGLSIG